MDKLKKSLFIVEQLSGGKRLSLKVFALERMENVTVGKVDGVPQASIDPNDYFAGSFGINHDSDQPVQEVRVRFFNSQVNYVRDKPLHPSQREIGRGDGWVVFAYELSLC